MVLAQYFLKFCASVWYQKEHGYTIGEKIAIYQAIVSYLDFKLMMMINYVWLSCDLGRAYITNNILNFVTKGERPDLGGSFDSIMKK